MDSATAGNEVSRWSYSTIDGSVVSEPTDRESMVCNLYIEPGLLSNPGSAGIVTPTTSAPAVTGTVRCGHAQNVCPQLHIP